DRQDAAARRGQHIVDFARDRVRNALGPDLQQQFRRLIGEFLGAEKAGELRRFSIKNAFRGPALNRPTNRTPEVPGLNVQAIQVGEDGAPPALTIRIPVTWPKKSATQETPFRLAPSPGTEVSLEAPGELVVEGRTLKFIGWAISGERAESEPRVTLKVEGAMKAVAYYQLVDEPNEPR
ncbi:MAG TPA: hypothetical protein VLV54_20465, partial [Thermoanaerobaculia bacterium]|nr:hypothetical protein [Thermoanaerobaculia bacterium]